MTNEQLEKILNSIPNILLAVGTLVTTLVTMFIALRTKAKAEAIEIQAKEIIHTTNSANSALQMKLDLSVERISGLEKLLSAQVDATKAATAATIPGPPGPTGEPGPTGPQGEKGDKGSRLLG